MTLKYNGKVGFKFGQHCVLFNPDWQLYAVIQEGYCQFMGTAAECLDAATRIVLDYYANCITPSWSN